MRPTSATTVQNPVLAQYITEYMETAGNQLAGTQCLPVYGVADRVGDIMIARREEMLGDQLDTARAPGGTYNRAGWEFERTSFSCTENGLEYPLDNVEVSQYSQYLPILELNGRIAATNLLKAQENRIEAELFNATTFSGYTAGVGTEWSTSTATPLADINTAKTAVRDNTGGQEADTMVLSRTNYNHLLHTVTEISGKLQYVTPLDFMPFEAQKRALEEYFGLNIIIGGAYYNSGLEGASATITAVWSNEYCLVFKKSMSPGEPGIGWTLLWTADSPSNVVAETYEEPQTRSNVLRVRQHTQENVFCAEFGYLLSNIHS
jgi:hypothetical protein